LKKNIFRPSFQNQLLILIPTVFYILFNGLGVESIEGIFRKSGSDKVIQQFKKKIEISKQIDFDKVEFHEFKK
jgi:hypothetical protein